jgi:RecG-like helicase
MRLLPSPGFRMLPRVNRPSRSLAEIPVTTLKGVGPRNAERLDKLGIHSVQDLLFHLPVRYQDRTRIAPIGQLRPGDQAVIEGVVEGADIRYGRRRSLLVVLADHSASITLRFFHFSNAQKAAMGRGARLRCFGEVRGGVRGPELPFGRADRPPSAGGLMRSPATSAAPQPMMRLLQGDVGSGKTVVAALAALQAVSSAGRQVALMAPTELLAEQHRKNLAGWLAPLGIEVAWLSGRTRARACGDPRAARLRERAGRVGTHALFQAEVVRRGPRAGDHRRAAPLRRPPAHGAAREGRRRAGCRTSSS